MNNTKFFFDSAEVVDDFNFANNSWIKVLSSFNNETTYKGKDVRGKGLVIRPTSQ